MRDRKMSVGCHCSSCGLSCSPTRFSLHFQRFWHIHDVRRQRLGTLLAEQLAVDVRTDVGETLGRQVHQHTNLVETEIATGENHQKDFLLRQELMEHDGQVAELRRELPDCLMTYPKKT